VRRGAILDRNKLPISKTMIAFELTDRPNRPITKHDDHVHSGNWFTNINNGKVFDVMNGDVATNRHGDAAHYLYADSRVELIPAEIIAEWCQAGNNFVRPPR
jgi:prepilin-type processing-associated H-X9-DG protein